MTKRDEFPLKLYDSTFLVDALEQLKVLKPTRRSFKKLCKDSGFRKAFVYLFWIFFALKFRERSFGDRDHYNYQDPITKKLLDNR